MATDGGKAEEEAKHFHCPWYHLRDPFLHMWQHHPHSQGGASQQSRAALCLPTHRLTQRRLVTEDCPGGLSRHWEGRASWKAQGVMFSAWSLTRLLWPLQIYGILSHRLKLSTIRSTNTSASRWVPPCFSTVGLYILQMECSSSPSCLSKRSSMLEGYAPHATSGLTGWCHKKSSALN